MQEESKSPESKKMRVGICRVNRLFVCGIVLQPMSWTFNVGMPMPLYGDA